MRCHSRLASRGALAWLSTRSTRPVQRALSIRSRPGSCTPLHARALLALLNLRCARRPRQNDRLEIRLFESQPAVSSTENPPWALSLRRLRAFVHIIWLCNVDLLVTRAEPTITIVCAWSTVLRCERVLHARSASDLLFCGAVPGHGRAARPLSASNTEELATLSPSRGSRLSRRQAPEATAHS